jgi:predicted nucleic acid-binding protein
MILIDTNVVSEMMKTSPTLSVIAWLDRQETTQLFLTTITYGAEKRIGASTQYT